MSTNALDQRVSIPAFLLGRVLGGLVILFLLFDGANRLVPWSTATDAMDRIGYGSSEAVERALGFISLACTAVYSIPPTSILGAILWTGYCGDAVVNYLRMF